MTYKNGEISEITSKSLGFYFLEKENLVKAVWREDTDSERIRKEAIYEISPEGKWELLHESYVKDEEIWTLAEDAECELDGERVTSNDYYPSIDKLFPSERALSLIQGHDFYQIQEYLGDFVQESYADAFIKMYESGEFLDSMGENYKQFAIVELGPDGDVALIGRNNEDILEEVGIAIYKDGLATRVYQADMATRLSFDIEKGYIYSKISYLRFDDESYYAVRNGCLLMRKGITGEPRAGLSGEDGSWVSFDPAIDGEYCYTVDDRCMYESEVKKLKEKLDNDKGNDIRIVDIGTYAEGLEGTVISFGSFYDVISE